MTPRQPTENKFPSAEHLLSAIVDSSDDAIISKNLDGIITSWNKSAERLFGYTEAEAVGKSVMMLIPDDRKDEEPRILAKLGNGERVEHFQTVRRRKDGELLQISLTISPVRDQTGTIVGASKVARDMTQYTRDMAELKKAREEALCYAEEARKQSRIKDEFLATLSHELRTPLQSILGWTQLLRAGDSPPEEIMEGVEVIERNALTQARIVEDLLDLNRILSAQVRLDVQTVALASVLSHSVDAVRPSAQAKGVRLEVIIDPLAKPVSGDTTRLQQIFWNLLTNAIKFTPGGGRVQTVLERVNSHIEVTVTDTGEGIEPEFLPFVFDRFRQADSSRKRTHGGLGLGLAIVKHLVELHGGTVRAKSAGPGKGASFIVNLPLSPVSGADDSSRRHPFAGESLSADLPRPRLDGLRVLVVDDSSDSRALVGKVLTRAGATVTEACSVQEAMSLIQSARPDVVVSDVGMPGQDGFDFIRQLRGLPEGKGRDIPAVALTAYTRVEDRIRALTEGFQMHLAKPADALELLTVVSHLAEPRSREREADRAAT